MARAAAAYGVLGALALVCAAEGPLRDVFAVALPDDIALSVAHYFRRSLEGVLTAIGLMLFLDLVVLPARRREAAGCRTERSVPAPEVDAPAPSTASV